MQATLTLPGADPITVHLTEAAYQTAITLSPEELSEAINDVLTDEPDPKLTEADYAAIGRGLAAMDAGDTIPADVVFARIREQYGWKKKDSGL